MARNRRAPMSQINVVPYIDVMLVLLIIFMVTAPLLQLGVQVQLPEVGDAQPLASDLKVTPLVVSIDADGTSYLDRGKQSEALNPKALAAEVVYELKQDPKRTVELRGHRLSSYENVARVLVALQNAGVLDVNIVTEPTTGVAGEDK